MITLVSTKENDQKTEGIRNLLQKKTEAFNLHSLDKRRLKNGSNKNI